MRKAQPSQSSLAVCLLVAILFLTTHCSIYAQGGVGINYNGLVPDPSAALDLNAYNKGLLIPRVALTTVNSAEPVSNPAISLLVYNTATDGYPPYDVVPGYYYWNGGQWILLLTSTASGSDFVWRLTGNAGTNPANNFIGTADNQPLVLKTNGQRSGFLPATADESLFLGYQAGVTNVGNFSVAVGADALHNNTSGYGNSALGKAALRNNTDGYSNSAVGYETLFNNTTGWYNSALGTDALFFNTTGNNNSALGYEALFYNTTGTSNTGAGRLTLFKNVTGSYNSVLGETAMYLNTTGSGNTAVGFQALYRNIAGDHNTAVGYAAGPMTEAGYSSFSETGAFGAYAANTASNQIRIGSTSITSIGGQVGWSNFSDQRFKVDVQENVAGLDFILKLRPVTYHWDLDSLNHFIYGPAAASLFADSAQQAGIVRQESITYTGFLAQEVETAAQSVGYDFSGVVAPANERTPYSIRYAEFVVPLVKAVQQQQSQLTQQSQLLTGLNSRLDRPILKLASADEWADRVFETGYRLRPLGEVESYLKQHKHLPGVPSARELTEQGVDVSQMLSKQMEKIEELTLYVVEQGRKIETLRELNKELDRKNQRLEELEKSVEELQKKLLPKKPIKSNSKQ
ncbi:tail fiber domain-containing protein [Persicitalea sp.]|uniref:tail fiber domain-containing protein n=1 Tax=Persicitalea sp. TaxID=3100273 RepID=UPI0035944AAB